jgi:carbon storage regulator
MLVLSRKVGQSIVIGKEVIVRVVRLSSNRAFLAIEAPESVRVDRNEIRLAKDREPRRAGFREAIGPQTESGETRQS